MPGLNLVCLVGEIRKEPDLAYAKSGLAICAVPLLVETVTRFDGNAKEYKALIDVKVFGKSGEQAVNLAVGEVVAVRGRVGSRTYEGKDGQTRIAIEIVADSIEPLNATNTPARGKAKPPREEPPQEQPEAGTESQGTY